MIEIDKMLHLRRYVMLVIRSQLYPPQCGTASGSLQHGGYVYMHPRHANPRSEIYVAACTRMYSTTISQSLRSDVVDHKLMSLYDNVKKGQISVDSLKEIIGLFGKNNYQLPHNTGVLLLKCCGNLLSDVNATERDHLAKQIWHLVKKNSETVTLEHYNTLLSVNEENSKSVNPKKFLANIDVEPDENTYRLLLNAATKTGNGEHVWDMLSMIKDKNMTIYEEAINAFVEICANSDNIAEFEQTVMLMRNAKLPTDKAYTELACRYAKLGDIPNLVKILNEEPQDNASLLRLIKVLSMSNNSKHIPVVLNFLMPSVPAIESEISKMIVDLIRAYRAVDAHAIINCLTVNNATKDVQSFVNSFMNELVMLNAPIKDIIQYANNFVDFGCNQQALLNVVETGLKLGREKLCLAIFQAMKNRNIEIRPHYYWPLLVRAHHNKGEPQIFSLIKSMMDLDVEIDSDTLINYVYPYINTANPIVTLQKLLSNNMSGINVYTPLLSFLLYQNRLQDIMLLCTFYIRYRVYYRELMKPLVHAYLATKDSYNCVMLLMTFPKGENFIGVFLKSLLKNEYSISIEELLLLLEELKIYKARISQEDAVKLKNRLQQNKNFNDVTKPVELINDLVDPSMIYIKNTLIPMYMNSRELTYYLVELKSIKASTKNILEKLLIMYCMENNLKKAEEIKREYDACEYIWTSNMKSFLFELYLKYNKLDEAEVLLPDLEIMPNEFHLDEIKIVMYATALVKADKLAKAFDVINTFNFTDNRDAKIECYKLLHTLAQSRHQASTKDMLNLLLKKNYCQVTMELLQPLVAIPLKHNHILDAVDVLTECAEKYHHAPLALEVLTVLLEQKYSAKLHKANNCIEYVYNLVATIQSVKIANTLLAIALATLNKTQKLKILLQTHELSMNCLEYYINNIKSDSGMDGLQNLFKIADVNDLQQSKLYKKLLFSYSRIGDCNRALKLWEIMRTKNIKPTEQFKNNFIQFLLSHKIPLPPEIGQSKSEINVSN